jgi:hypothetical protein
MGTTKRKRSPLERAIEEAPPQRTGRPSVLDGDEVRTECEAYLRARIDNANRPIDQRVGSIPWFNANVVESHFGIVAADSTVQAYLRSHWPDLYREAMRS